MIAPFRLRGATRVGCAVRVLAAGASIAVLAPGAAAADAPPTAVQLRLPLADCVLVHEDHPPESVQLAVAAFVERAKFLGDAPRKVVAASQVTAAERAANHLIVVGQLAANAVAEELAGERVRRNLGKDVDWVREQGFEVDLFRRGEGDKLVIVGGAVGRLGAVYAISDLEMRLAASAGHAALVLDDLLQKHSVAAGTPAARDTAALSREKLSLCAMAVEKPAIAERGEYLNFSGTPDRYVLPIGWQRREWEEHVDQCVKARLTFISVYIWSSQILAAAENDEQAAELRKLHENIRYGLEYAHRRGLKFKYLFTPSTVPQQVYDSSPADYRAPKTHYSWPAFKLLHPGALAAIKKIYGPQLEMFREADAVHIFFFDPGGDFSDEFVADWGHNLAKHLIDFEQFAHHYAPQAKIEFNLWNADYFAPIYRPFAEDLLRALREHYGEKTSELSVFCDSKYAKLAKDLGFRTERFLFETNHERAYVFFTPQIPRVYRDTRELAPLYDSVFCHRVEGGSKFPNTFICSSWFWNPNVTISEILDRYGLWVVGPEAKDQLAEAILTLDRITFEPDNLMFARDLEAQTRQAELGVAPQVRDQVEWLYTSLYATAGLAELAQAKSPAERQQLETEITKRLRDSRMFRPSLEMWIDRTGQLSKWAKMVSVGNRVSGF